MFSKLIYSMAVAINIVFVTMTAVAILLVPITMTYQYNGFTRNPNSFGEQLIASFPALLYLFYCAKRKIAKRFHFVLICISLAFTFFSRSRTTLLAVTGMLLCFLILYAYKEIYYFYKNGSCYFIRYHYLCCRTIWT